MPDARLFMVELRVASRAEVVRWYQEIFEFAVLLVDDHGDFTLLDAGPCRLAIKGGTAAGIGSISLVFEVSDVEKTRNRFISRGVELGPVITSDEGFIATRLIDPAGNPIQLFQWLKPE